jgi:hypothetical protein
MLRLLLVTVCALALGAGLAVAQQPQPTPAPQGYGGGGAGQLTAPPASTEPPVPETAVAEEEDTGPSPLIIVGAALVAIGIIAFFIIWMRKRIAHDRPGSSRKHRPPMPTLATPRAAASQRPRGRSRSAGAPPPPPRKRAGKAHKKKRSR